MRQYREASWRDDKVNWRVSGKEDHMVGGLQGSLCRAQKRGTVNTRALQTDQAFRKEKVNTTQGKSCMIPTVYKGGQGRGQERTNFPGEETAVRTNNLEGVNGGIMISFSCRKVLRSKAG